NPLIPTRPGRLAHPPHPAHPSHPALAEGKVEYRRKKKSSRVLMWRLCGWSGWRGRVRPVGQSAFGHGDAGDGDGLSVSVNKKEPLPMSNKSYRAKMSAALRGP